MARLVEDLRAFARETGEPVTVVFDGRPRGLHESEPVEVAFAPGGRNSADDEIARRVQADEQPGEIRVVTSDGALAGAGPRRGRRGRRRGQLPQPARRPLAG